MKTSEKFEKQIYRIHALLEQSESKVTWDDYIPDPDNCDQPRQIDITIKRDNKLTLVECRIHKKKQNVKWIEELIGRKQSLHADAIIAVSSSGFTPGAIKKAEKYGIILRDLLTLTKEEIRKWGHATKVWLTFYQYYETFIKIIVDLDRTKAKSIQETYALIVRENIIYKTFATVKTFLNKRDLSDNTGKIARVKYRFHLDDSNFEDIVIKEVQFESKVKVITKYLSTPSVVVYDEPEISSLDRKVFIEKLDFGDFEITHSSGDVSAVIDLSILKNPKNSQFNSIRFDFEDPVSFKKIYFLGFKQFSIPLKKIKIEIECF